MFKNDNKKHKLKTQSKSNKSTNKFRVVKRGYKNEKKKEEQNGVRPRHVALKEIEVYY